MKVFGREVVWSEPTETRSLDVVTDIGIAFEERIAHLSGTDPLEIPEIMRARQLTADTVASLPMQELFGSIVADVVPPILERPDPQEVYHDTISGLMFDLLDDGFAALWVKSRDAVTGRPKAVYVIPGHEVSVAWDSRQLYRLYSWRDRTLEPFSEIIPISLNRRRRDLKGRGVVQTAKDNMIATLRAQADMARSIAEDNYTPTTVIKHPSVKTVDEATRVRDMWMGDRATRGRNSPAVVDALTELDQLTINPSDAQWVESRHYEVQAVARAFGIPGWVFLVDQGTSMTYSNTEGIMRFWATTTLRPSYLERIEQAFSALLPEGRTARFNMDEILRADLEARYRAYELGIRNRFLTANEVRESEHLPPIAGGDDLAAAAIPSEVSA